MELKGVEKLDNFITSFVKKLGYDINCTLDTDFFYYPVSKRIGYSLFTMELADKGFKEYIKINYPNLPTCSIFTFSILHELGHFLTYDLLSEIEICLCLDEKERLNNREITTEEDTIQKQIDYCSIYDEMIATKTATAILINSYDIVADFDNHFIEKVSEFYAENEVELD